VGSSALFFHRDLAILTWKFGLLYLGLMLPLIATFHQTDGRQKMFAAYTVGVALCIAVATIQCFNFCAEATPLWDLEQVPAAKFAELKALQGSAGQWFEYSLWGIVLSTWLGAGLSVTPVRH
jgi:hypothetical protein